MRIWLPPCALQACLYVYECVYVCVCRNQTEDSPVQLQPACDRISLVGMLSGHWNDLCRQNVQLEASKCKLEADQVSICLSCPSPPWQ